MSVMMSDMKTASKKAAKKARARTAKPLRREFTVRDMNRSGAELLEAARKLGSVTIRSRAGEAFEVRSVKEVPTVPAAANSMLERMRRHRERLAEIGQAAIEARQIEISSTDLRRRLVAGLSVRYLVPRSVEIYLQNNRVYQPAKES